MAGISGVTSTNKYTDKELDGLAGHEKDSTQSAVNSISGHAGATYDLTLHGRDPTVAEVKTAHQDRVAAEWGQGTAHELDNQGGEVAADYALEHVGVESAGLLLLPYTLGRAGVEMTKAVIEDHEAGLDRTNAQSREVLHAFVLTNINGLPNEYVSSQTAKFSKDAMNGNAWNKLTARLQVDADHAQVALIQLHADQGIQSARDACDAKMAPADYLRTHPDAAARYQSDPAFRHGFDGLMFARDRGKGSYDAVIASFEARNAAYRDHHVQVRL